MFRKLKSAFKRIFAKSEKEPSLSVAGRGSRREKASFAPCMGAPSAIGVPQSAFEKRSPFQGSFARGLFFWWLTLFDL